MIRLLLSALAFGLVLSTSLVGQTEPATLSAGTLLVVALDGNCPMRTGAPIRGKLVYPVYASNKLVLPKGAAVMGSVEALHSDRARRTRSELGGDFTPFHRPEVHFDRVILTDGSTLPIISTAVGDGAPIYEAMAPAPSKGGLLRREFNAGLSAARGDIAAFAAPGKGDRLLQFIYARLPYHPEHIDAGTAWTFETAAAVEVPPISTEAAPVAPAPARRRHFWDEPVQVPAEANNTGVWIVKANLKDPLSSETSQAGQAIQATVAEPIYTADHELALPQGAVLTGSVTRARHSRSFGRAGVLSFNFTQLTLPSSETQTIETRLTGADSAAQIALNSEGQITSKPQDKITIPLILALMASRPLDIDEGKAHGPHATAGKNAVGGSASLSLVGTIVAVAGGSPYVAAGIGYWGTARSFYARWIAHGQKIAFPKGTRIVVETTPRKTSPLRPMSRP
jgi:hypothetical protein